MSEPKYLTVFLSMAIHFCRLQSPRDGHPTGFGEKQGTLHLTACTIIACSEAKAFWFS